jgi:hypothetical protein
MSRGSFDRESVGRPLGRSRGGGLRADGRRGVGWGAASAGRAPFCCDAVRAGTAAGAGAVSFSDRFSCDQC